MKADKKSITIVSLLLSVIIGGAVIAFCLLFLNKNNDVRAIPYVNPVVAEQTYYVENGLPEISLSKGDTPGEIAWVGGQEITEGTKEYKWRFVPIKSRVYKEISGKVELTFLNKKDVRLNIDPVTTMLTYGLNLSYSTFTGGRVVEENDTTVEVSGKWAWSNPLHVPQAKEGNQYFQAVFTPDNELYKKLEWLIPVKVNKRDLVVTPSYGLYKYYGDEDPENLEYNIVGNVIGEDPAFSGSLLREPGEAYGNYAVTLGSLKLEDNDKTGFKKSNYNLVLNQEATYDYSFKICEKIELTDVSISGVLLKENENVKIKPYDAISISNVVYQPNMVPDEYDITYKKIVNGNVSNTSLSYHNIINPGEYLVDISIKANDESIYRSNNFRYYFSIEKAEHDSYKPNFDVAVNYKNGMTLQDVLINDISGDYTLTWQSNLNEAIKPGDNTFTALFTPSNTMLYKEQLVQVTIYANNAANIEANIVPVVFNGTNCSMEEYSQDYNTSYVSSSNEDYKFKINFKEDYGKLNSEKLTVKYRYKNNDGSVSYDILNPSYYSFVYKFGYNFESRDKFNTDLEYNICQSDSRARDNYLDISLDYIQITPDGVNFLKNSNASLLFNMSVYPAFRYVRNIESDTSIIVHENLLDISESQWNFYNTSNNYIINYSKYCFFYNADLTDYCAVLAGTAYVKPKQFKNIDSQNINLYHVNRQESGYAITYVYEDKLGTEHELFKYIKEENSTYFEGNSITAYTYKFDFVDPATNAKVIPVGWCLDKYGNTEVKTDYYSFIYFGTSLKVYLITIDPFTVEYKDKVTGKNLKTEYITSNSQIPQNVEYYAYYDNNYSYGFCNYSMYSFYKLIKDNKIAVYNNNNDYNEVYEDISEDDIIVGNWDVDKNYNNNNNGKYAYLQVEKDGTFISYYIDPDNNYNNCIYTGKVQKYIRGVNNFSYKFKYETKNGSAYTGSFTISIYSSDLNRLYYDESVNEYVKGVSFNTGYFSSYSYNYFYKKQIPTKFKVVNLVEKDNLTSSTYNLNKWIKVDYSEENTNCVINLNEYNIDYASKYFYTDYEKCALLPIFKDEENFEDYLNEVKLNVTSDQLNVTNFGNLTCIYVLNTSIEETINTLNYVPVEINLLNGEVKTINLYDKTQEEAKNIFDVYFNKLVEDSKPQNATQYSFIKWVFTYKNSSSQYIVDASSNINDNYNLTYYIDMYVLNSSYKDFVFTPIVRLTDFETSISEFIGEAETVKYYYDNGGRNYTLTFNKNGIVFAKYDDTNVITFGTYDYDSKNNIGYLNVSGNGGVGVSIYGLFSFNEGSDKINVYQSSYINNAYVFDKVVE